MKLRIRTQKPSKRSSPVALPWKEADFEDSVTRLGEYVESLAEERIDWFYRKRRSKRRFSQALRWASLALFAAGGATPLVQAALPDLREGFGIDIGHAGYLLMATAAACVACDRFFGLSSGWIRYITTALALETELAEFRLEWTRLRAQSRGGPTSPEALDALLSLSAETAGRIQAEAEKETTAWRAEFESNLARFEQKLRQDHKRAA